MILKNLERFNVYNLLFCCYKEGTRLEENYLWKLVDLQAGVIRELRRELRRTKMGLETMTQKYMELEEILRRDTEIGLIHT